MKFKKSCDETESGLPAFGGTVQTEASASQLAPKTRCTLNNLKSLV